MASWNVQSNMADSFKSEMHSSRCFLCEKYLSVPPIMIISSDGEEQKCGRCREIKTEINVRNTFYEKMARITEYPCIYEDCEEKLCWGEVESHEEVCLHRTMNCPMFEECDETIKISDLESHFDSEHSGDLYYETYDVMGDIFSEMMTILLLSHGKPYLIKSGVTEDNYSCQVFALHPDGNRKYELKIFSEVSENFKLLFEGETIFFKENEHCFKCAARECQERSHWNSTLYQNSPPISHNVALIDINVIKFALKSPDFHTTFIVKNDNISSSDDSKVSKNFLSNNNTVLIDRILQCPVCEETMSSPIHICPTGHSLCNNCKSRLDSCPTCKDPFGDTRNFSLEDLADNAELPCQNENEGCNFFGNVEVLGRHQVDCER
nr:uncharacterized protein LOC111510864 [Leptinotarsa decemlineata]XP_023022587.1 uncharacterized protein LOC111510864 [Leptinotarsa decemlineata]